MQARSCCRANAREAQARQRVELQKAQALEQAQLLEALQRVELQELALQLELLLLLSPVPCVETL